MGPARVTRAAFTRAAIAEDEPSITELVQFCLACGAEEIFAEPVNARGPGLRLVEQSVGAAGFAREAEAVRQVRKRAAWSAYCTSLIVTVQRVMERFNAIHKLRFLLYPSNLLDGDLLRIQGRDLGIRWLGK